MIQKSTDGKTRILSLSYGKDSIACLFALEKLGWPLDGIAHAEVWFDDDTPSDLPPMVEFKRKADAIILERFGIEVQHVFALDKKHQKLTYKDIFYRKRGQKMDTQRTKEKSSMGGQLSEEIDVNKCPKKRRWDIYGFPPHTMPWCQSKLKGDILDRAVCRSGGADKNSVVKYLGIALDEPERIERHKKKANIELPLATIGWDERYCKTICEENGLLSPIYTTATRGGVGSAIIKA